MSVERRRAAIGGRRRPLVWAVLAAALGICLGGVPLFGVLGFELATATALFAAVMGLDLGSAMARARARRPASGIDRATYAGRTMARATLAASGRAVALILIPAVIAAVRGLWLPTCDWGFGIACYLAMPVATAALAGALGHALGVACGPRRFVGAAVAQLPALAVALAALYRFYSEPPVVSYNAILGYFPGNLYDENIRLHGALAWSRLADLAWVVAIVALVTLRLDVPRHRLVWRDPRPAGRRLGTWLVALVAIAGAAVLYAESGALGYAVDAEDIEDVLDGRIETAHFIIHYAHTTEIDADIAAIAEDHEFRYAEIVAQTGVAPAGKLRSFYFADREQKARWFGARDVEMAKPWRREIYLEHRAFPHGSLRHEIAHAVASAFGDPLFGVATRHVVFANPGLIEGLAVALDWPGGYDRPTPHEAVRAMQGLGVEPSIGQLLSLQFFSVSSARGYTTAGSFLRFLLDSHGPAKLRALYRSGGDFVASYGVPLATLEAAWRTMIGTIELPPNAVEAQRERFRGVSMFARPCPHAIAARRERAARALATGERGAAIDLLRRVCGDAPEEPRHRLELGDLLVRGSAVEHLEATALWTGLANEPARRGARAARARRSRPRRSRRGRGADPAGLGAAGRRRRAPPARRRGVRARAARPGGGPALRVLLPARHARRRDARAVGGDRRADAGLRALRARPAAPEPRAVGRRRRRARSRADPGAARRPVRAQRGPPARDRGVPQPRSRAGRARDPHAVGPRHDDVGSPARQGLAGSPDLRRQASLVATCR